MEIVELLIIVFIIVISLIFIKKYKRSRYWCKLKNTEIGALVNSRAYQEFKGEKTDLNDFLTIFNMLSGKRFIFEKTENSYCIRCTKTGVILAEYIK